MDPFEQPNLNDGNAVAASEVNNPFNKPRNSVARVNPNDGKTDELSVASRARRIEPVVEVEPEPGKYCLDYEYNGQAIHETHRTLDLALSSMRRLKMMGIVPATSTAD